MMKERASIFGDDDALDVSDFKPKPAHRPDPEAVRATAAAKGFTSRESSAEPAQEATPRPRRRRRTGRLQQLNIRVSAAYSDQFLALADRLDLSQAETFERAIEALKRELD
jgi:hypothetical protein